MLICSDGHGHGKHYTLALHMAQSTAAPEYSLTELPAWLATRAAHPQPNYCGQVLSTLFSHKGIGGPSLQAPRNDAGLWLILDTFIM